MSNSTAQVLMKKGKRGAAAYILADCASGNPQHLGPLLDVLLNPSKTIDEWEIVDWCRWLMAGGRTPDEFAAVVRSYDKHDKCGLVWIPRVVAYRCRTCGISPCMSICRDCFHRGDHSTHDFNMFLSQAGGACDCGDNSVMKEDGFCSNHGNKCPRPGAAPAELMCVAEAMMPRLILRLLQHFRENSSGSQTNSDSYRIAVQECEGYVQMLMEFNNMGDLMRSAMTKALINPQMYRELVQPPFPSTEFGRYMCESHNMYNSAVDAFPAPAPPPMYRHLPALAPRLQHHTLLDELIFWTFKYEFPQNVVCFLLNMLPDQDYKEHLTRTFVLHYARIPLVLEAAADPDTLSNRVVHMSVQLFSNEALALRCVQQLQLLHVMVLSLRLMMGKILIRSTLHSGAEGGPDGSHLVIDCTRRVMKEHCYWPLVSDFNNVLSHKSVALLFLQDDALLDMWFGFLSLLQGMNVNVRETGSHIEFEPSSYYAAFSCELEAAAYPMWSVLSHLTSPAHAPLCARVVSAAVTALTRWLKSLSPPQPLGEGRRASFHFPLHRYLAAFLCCGARCMGLDAGSLLPPPATLLQLAAHPLSVQSLFYEILAGIWVRNGLQIKGQAMTYIQANFCNSMVDMDIYWLQICAGHLPPDQFLNLCIDTFGVREWLSMAPMSPVQAAEQDSMVEGLLTFLAIIVSSRSNLGNDELTQSRLEVSTLLAAGDKTHSQLLELMPERSGNAHTRNFEMVLKELSTYRPPPKGSESLEQGLFVPKPIVWEQYYDPLHVLRRAVHRRDFHASMERFTAYVREQQKSSGTGTVPPGPLWPPLRAAAAPPPAAPDPRQLCSSGVLHGMILSVLHRAVHCRGETAAHAPHAPADHVVAIAVHLLHTGIPESAQTAMDVAITGTGGGWSPPLLEALRGDVCGNARTHVARACVPRVAVSEPAPAMYHTDSDTEWEPSGVGAVAESLPPPAASTALAVPQPLQITRASHGSVEGSEEEDDAREAGSGLLALRDARHSLALALPAPAPPELAPSILHDMEESEWEMSDTLRPALPAPSESPPPPSQEMQVQLTHEDDSDGDTVLVNESIISLLLKLHSQLSGRLDSFSLEDKPEPEGCIGDGPYFIGQALRKLCAADPRCADTVNSVRRALWPLRREKQAELRARERREKEERSRRARERQAAVMREFQRRQQQFLAACGDQVEQADPEPPAAPHYTCVICGGAAVSSHSDPLGLVTLLQSTSVLGHARTAAAPTSLPLSDAARAQLRSECAMQHHYRRHDDLQQHTDESWVLSVSVGYEGGVALASCGHRLHLRCLRAYLRSLRAGQRPHSLHVERGEFLCPLCRQLANAALPLAPPSSPPSAPAPNTTTHLELAEEVLELLSKEQAPPPLTRLSEAMGKAMEDMTATAGNKLRVRYGSSAASVLTFVASLLRGNLELALVARGGNLLQQPPPRYRPRDDCLLPLLSLCGAHARVLRSAADLPRTWSLLSGAGSSSAAAVEGVAAAGALVRGRSSPPPVPLLLKDTVHLFMLLLLDQPAYHIRHFTCIVRSLYTLTYYQIILQLVAGGTAEERASLCVGAARGAGAAASALLRALATSELFTEDGPCASQAAAPLPPAAAHQLERLLLPLARVAMLVKHQVYGVPLPVAASPEEELPTLLAGLHLHPTSQPFDVSAPLAENHLELAATWAAELASSARCAQLAIRRLALSMHVEWQCPRLLRLPREYERVFSHYHERVCTQCGAVPKECGVCLLCGALVCLKQACCRRAHRAEATQHALECGGGTGIFLVVTSTYIVVIRGGRACLWGSLYLDDYDEEDRDLKRGKPLYLSQDRFELLEAQWLAHRFDHTKRTWVWHRDSL